MTLAPETRTDVGAIRELPTQAYGKFTKGEVIAWT